MASLYLIRHGQASFGHDDYDQLSALGEQQAKILGKHWQHYPALDKCYSGNLLRHQQTAEHFLIGLNQEPLKSHAVINHSGFNEFNHVDVLAQLPCDQEISKDASKEIFEKAFIQAMTRWLSGKFDHEYQESWLQFKSRCLQALTEVIEQNNRCVNPAKEIAIFTSGGPISLIIGHILGLTDEKALMLNKQLANSSVTKLIFSGKRLSLDYLNNYTHIDLAGKKWLSYL